MKLKWNCLIKTDQQKASLYYLLYLSLTFNIYLSLNHFSLIIRLWLLVVSLSIFFYKSDEFNHFVRKLSSESHLVATDTSNEVQVFLFIDN